MPSRTRRAATAPPPSSPGGPMPFVEYGDSGINRYGGRLNEEFIPELKGDRGRKVLREMAWNDPVIGAGLFVIRMLLRQAPVSVEAGGTSPQDQLAHDLVDTARSDMSLTWEDTVSDICSMFPFGHAFLEVIYKRREGPWETDGARRSQHADGLIGWRKWALRSQLSLDHWELDASGGVQAMVQRPTLGSAVRREKPAGARGMGLVIPIAKALLFKTDNAGGNPEGLSVIRNAYKPYYFGKRIEMLEGIGIERDMAGLPEIKIPGEFLQANATPEKKAVAEAYRRLGEQLRNDRMSCALLPSDRDKDGNALYEFNLKSANGRRQFDTNVVLSRYAVQKAMVMLTDFILLGHEKVGSFALSDGKTALFGIALSAWHNAMLGVINRHEIPRLLALNGIRVERPPRLVGGEILAPSLAELSRLIGELSGAGMPLFPDDALEAAIRKRAGFPAKESDDYMTGKRRPSAKVGSATWLAEEEDLLGEKAGDFDETRHRRHPRGSSDGGKFAPKGESNVTQFASPNVGDELSLAEAERYRRSPRHRWFSKEVQRLDREAGVAGTYSDALGAWTTGKETSVVSEFRADRDTAVYLAALKGRAGRQIAVANFFEHERGPHLMHQVATSVRSRRALIASCQKAGLEHFTLARRGAGTSIYVIDTGGGTSQIVAGLAKAHGTIRVETTRGWADFIGHSSDRSRAQVEYDRIIRAYHRRHRRGDVRRRNPPGSQHAVRRRRSSPLTRKRADLDDEDGELDDPDPDDDWGDDEGDHLP